jgi:hypothetical protein
MTQAKFNLGQMRLVSGDNGAELEASWIRLG